MREKIMVSACLMGVNCRYDGKSSTCEEIKEYVKDKEVYLICPEQLGGLPTPRTRCEKKRDRVIDEWQKDQSEAFWKGAQAVLQLAKQQQIKVAILKSKSPSCGIGKIYNGEFNGTLVDGMGICAALLRDNSIKLINSDELCFKIANETKKAL